VAVIVRNGKCGSSLGYRLCDIDKLVRGRWLCKHFLPPVEATGGYAMLFAESRPGEPAGISTAEANVVTKFLLWWWLMRRKIAGI